MPMVLTPPKCRVTLLVFLIVRVASVPHLLLPNPKLYEMGLGSGVSPIDGKRRRRVHTGTQHLQLCLGAKRVVVDDDIGRSNARAGRIERYAERAALPDAHDRGTVGHDRSSTGVEISCFTAGGGDSTQVQRNVGGVREGHVLVSAWRPYSLGREPQDVVLDIGVCNRGACPHPGSRQLERRIGACSAPARIEDIDNARSGTRTGRLELNGQGAVRVGGDVAAVVPVEEEVGRVTDRGNRNGGDDLGGGAVVVHSHNEGIVARRRRLRLGRRAWSGSRSGS